MADVKDILGVSRSAPAEKPEPVAKQAKPKTKRPEGMSREAYALLGDQHPIISTQLVTKKKKEMKAKPVTKAIVTWQWKQIVSSARTDDLKVFHWSKGYKDAQGRMKEPDDSDYYFAKYNKKVQLMKYNDEEYNNLIAPDSGDWSRAETDYLFELCERFDLRFIVIADRYEYVAPAGAQPSGTPLRTCEDLKDRYYTIVRRLLIAREGGEAPVANQQLVKQPYNKTAEIDRKKAIEMLLQRTPQQTLEDNAILNEARLIEERWKAEAAASKREAEARQKAEEAARRAEEAKRNAPPADSPQTIAQLLMQSAAAGTYQLPPTFSNDPGPGNPSLLSAAVEPSKPPKPGVYPRAVHTLGLVNKITESLPGGQKSQKAMETLLNDIQWLPALFHPRVGTRAVCASWLALREELVQYMELRRLAGKTGQQQQEGGATRQKRKR